MGSSEEALKQELEDITKQLAKKTKFEEAVSSLRSLLFHRYSSSSPPLQKSFYNVICRVATVLRTRYTAPGFWVAGFELFQEAERLASDSSEKQNFKNFVAQAKQHLHQTDNVVAENSQSSSGGGYLFEGHLTVDPEPPQPQWLVQSNLLNSMTSVLEAQSRRSHSTNNDTTAESAANLLEELITQLDEVIPEIIGDGSGVPRAPPASKEVVAKLPVITVTEETFAKLGKDAECAICKENLVVDDKMQELPCKHTFHPPCLKPWLDEHNSCPICRHELQTDDHSYESWKEREKEAEEERKGAANAVRGGEFMYL